MGWWDDEPVVLPCPTYICCVQPLWVCHVQPVILPCGLLNIPNVCCLRTACSCKISNSIAVSCHYFWKLSIADHPPNEQKQKAHIELWTRGCFASQVAALLKKLETPTLVRKTQSGRDTGKNMWWMDSWYIKVDYGKVTSTYIVYLFRDTDN